MKAASAPLWMGHAALLGVGYTVAVFQEECNSRVFSFLVPESEQGFVRC
jgi:hypothetical protein